MAVPLPVQAAFEEALEIHRTVSGRESSVASFVEAMVAESYAGLNPPDVEVLPIRHEEAQAAREERLARHTKNWRELGRDSEGPDILDEVGILLVRATVVSGHAGCGDARDLDNQLRVLIGLEEESECLLGRFLMEMGDRGAWSELRFAGVGHYGEQRLGMSRTSAEDRASLARALRALPLLREAYEMGWVGFESALLVRRALGPGPVERRIERTWVLHARDVTVKRLRDEVRMMTRARAEIPASARPFEAGGASFVSRDGLSASQLESPPGDALWRESLHRSPGMAMTRIARLGHVAAEGGFPDVFLRLRLEEDVAASFLSAIESRRRALARSATDELHATGRSERCEVASSHPESSAPALGSIDEAAMSGSSPRTFSDLAGVAGSVLAARTFSARNQAVPAWVGLLALIEEFAVTWDDPKQAPKRAADAVYKRDGWRCTAPGCLSRNHLEEHHIRYRSRGGSNDLDNRICVCWFHHREGEHGRFARVRGSAPFETHWTLGKHGEGGSYLNEKRL